MGLDAIDLLQRASYPANAGDRRYRLPAVYRGPEKRGERLPSLMSLGLLPLPQMSGKPLCREAIRYQIRDRIPGPIVDQQILTILLVNTPG